MLTIYSKDGKVIKQFSFRKFCKDVAKDWNTMKPVDKVGIVGLGVGIASILGITLKNRRDIQYCMNEFPKIDAYLGHKEADICREFAIDKHEIQNLWTAIDDHADHIDELTDILDKVVR
jgi:hypothetical protein